ncbi:uncharacterized protein LOC109598740 isoform X2 [Aethina tumida]|uniref:uncharacterized protein LOC109598740 isoform X2 n=1 Tax=Aethina tumida TaxID=116153 RepID=UPI0021478AC8|nr:uncharacterized protein LOC109598740 isoform X2 [Aethina tumida]
MCAAFIWLQCVLYGIFVERLLSIMSGDSPNAHRDQNFDFTKESRSSPLPTTSREHTLQSTAVPDAQKASVAVEPEKKEGEPLDICCPTLNNDECEDKRRNSDASDKAKFDDRDRDTPDKNEKRKLNGGDKLDGVWVTPKKKPEEVEEDDNCLVKCLYYTMQCCECNVM